MPALLRFDGACEHDPALDGWAARLAPQPLAALAGHWFEWLRRAGPGVRELLHDGLATVCLGDAPFAYVGAFKAHVNVGFFEGASLPDPAGVLQGRGKRLRHVRLVPGDPGLVAIEAVLPALIDAAYRGIAARVAAGD